MQRRHSMKKTLPRTLIALLLKYLILFSLVILTLNIIKISFLHYFRAHHWESPPSPAQPPNPNYPSESFHNCKFETVNTEKPYNIFKLKKLWNLSHCTSVAARPELYALPTLPYLTTSFSVENLTFLFWRDITSHILYSEIWSLFGFQVYHFHDLLLLTSKISVELGGIFGGLPAEP